MSTSELKTFFKKFHTKIFFNGVIKIFVQKYCEPIQICRRKNCVTLFTYQEYSGGFKIKIFIKKINETNDPQL